MSEDEYSVSPDGERFRLPTENDHEKEFEKIKQLVDARRELGKEIVVVMGVGFVGVVMAAVVADSGDDKFVIGMQRPSVRSYWKIPI
ncbi:MAG TPA: GDP-mannose dehydrogenase, partial [Euryarchaeota archaeon]|nr:GDP-mannose dehydrogenase [Euryarchaeota archaeon]